MLPQAREPKRRFVPSKWEAKAVLRIIRSLRKNPDARARKDARESDDAPKASVEGDEDRDETQRSCVPPRAAREAAHARGLVQPPFEYVADAQVDENGDEVSAPRAPTTRCAACLRTRRSCWSASSGAWTSTSAHASRRRA